MLYIHERYGYMLYIHACETYYCEVNKIIISGGRDEEMSFIQANVIFSNVDSFLWCP